MPRTPLHLQLLRKVLIVGSLLIKSSWSFSGCKNCRHPSVNFNFDSLIKPSLNNIVQNIPFMTHIHVHAHITNKFNAHMAGTETQKAQGDGQDEGQQ